MNIKLEVIDCKTDHQTVELFLPATLGRGERSDLVIAHAEVSRRHCRIFEYRGVVHIQDLNSLNGTYVNGQRLSQQEVRVMPGDKFSIGPLKFVVLYEVAQRGGSSAKGAAGRPSQRGSSSAAKRISQETVPMPLDDKTMPVEEVGSSHATRMDN